MSRTSLTGILRNLAEPLVCGRYRPDPRRIFAADLTVLSPGARIVVRWLHGHRRPNAATSHGSSPSTTTWSSRPTSGPPGSRRSTSTGRRVEHDSAVFHFEGGNFTFEKGVEGGEPCDWWLYDDLVYPFPKLSAAVGFPELDVTPTTFDEIRAGCWKQAGTPRRHGHQLHGGVDLLPEHAPPLLRPDVLRARRPRPRAALRAGLQRLGDRRVVRR